MLVHLSPMPIAPRHIGETWRPADGANWRCRPKRVGGGGAGPKRFDIIFSAGGLQWE